MTDFKDIELKEIYNKTQNQEVCGCGHDKGNHFWDIPNNKPSSCDKCRCKKFKPKKAGVGK